MKEPLLEGGSAQCRHTVVSPWWKPRQHLERLWQTEVPWLCCAVISPTAEWGAPLCVVEGFKTIFINMIKYLLHESAIRASLNQWTQRSLLIYLWNPSGITDGSGEGGWMQLSVTEARSPPRSLPAPTHAALLAPHSGKRAFIFLFAHSWAKNQGLPWLWQWDFKYTLSGCDTGTFFWWQDITQL